MGILIALEVNNWNEDRQLNYREQELISQLKDDINLLLLELDSDIAFAESNIANLDALLFYDSIKSEKDWVYYFMQRPTANPMLFPTKATFENLKSMGIDVITDSALRNQITELYDRRLTRAAVWETNVYDYEDRVMLLMERFFNAVPDSSNENSRVLLPDTYNSFRSNKELYNAILSYQEKRKYMVFMYKEVQGLALEIIDELTNY